MDFKTWKTHFENNTIHFDHINWNDNYQLSPTELKAITSSVQQFQKGESSEGKNLILSAKTFEKDYKVKNYTDTIKCFIKEEQSHSRALGKFMESQSISFISDHWVDQLFRFLRSGSNIERAILVLSSAELIATQYYVALRDATESKVLKSICSQILIDEDNHIRFQAFALNQIYSTKSKLKVRFSKLVHLILLIGTTCSVFIIHRNVFKKAGWSFGKFSSGCLNEFFYLQKMILNKHKQSNSSYKIPFSYETTI